MRKAVITLTVILILSVCTLAGIYLWGYNRYDGTYPPNFYVDGQDYSGMNPDEVCESLQNKTATRTVELVTKNGEAYTYTFAGLGISEPSDGDVYEWDRARWYEHILTPTHILTLPHLTIDRDALTAFVNSLPIVTTPHSLPSSAHFIRHPNGDYELIPHEDGEELIPARVVNRIEECVLNGVWEVDLTACYRQAKIIESEEMSEWVKSANAYIRTHIILDLGAGLIIDIPQDVLIKSCRVDYDGFHTDPSVITDYLTTLRQHNTINTERTFSTSLGTTVTLKPRSRDNFGGWELDEERLYELVAEAMEEVGEEVRVEVPWKNKGVTHGEDNDFGSTYIEISIEKQRMWFYKDGKLIVETPVVTGCVANGTDTPRGMFKVLQKATEYTMKGSYGTAFCHYFIRVTWTGIAIHDALWRGAFGGTIYKTNGSHGCINTPYANVKQIFDAVSYGTPIIIW